MDPLLRLRFTGAFDRERHPLWRLLGDANNTTGKIAILRPQVKKRLCRRAPDLPRNRRQGTAAALADLKAPGGEKILQAGSQLVG
jgi:hypothetical protein